VDCLQPPSHVQPRTIRESCRHRHIRQYVPGLRGWEIFDQQQRGNMHCVSSRQISGHRRSDTMHSLCRWHRGTISRLRRLRHVCGRHVRRDGRNLVPAVHSRSVFGEWRSWLHVVHGWQIRCVRFILDVHCLRCWEVVDSRRIRVHGMQCWHVFGGGGCPVYRVWRWYILGDVWSVEM
jgi:hypothetical protein